MCLSPKSPQWEMHRLADTAVRVFLIKKIPQRAFDICSLNFPQNSSLCQTYSKIQHIIYNLIQLLMFCSYHNIPETSVGGCFMGNWNERQKSTGEETPIFQI